jgi:hypothetical protein
MTTNTTKAPKMTKRDYYNAIKNKYPLTEDEVKFIDHEIELLDKKNSADKKPSKEQVANAMASASLLNWMEINKVYTIGDLIKSCPVCEGLSNPKVTALLRPLKDNGSVVRTEEKRKVYFTRVA